MSKNNLTRTVYFRRLVLIRQSRNASHLGLAWRQLRQLWAMAGAMADSQSNGRAA